MNIPCVLVVGMLWGKVALKGIIAQVKVKIMEQPILLNPYPSGSGIENTGNRFVCRGVYVGKAMK